MPKIQTEVPIPPLIGTGTYKIVVQADDLIAKTHVELAVPFEVRGHNAAASEKLTAATFRFFRGEEDPQPLEKAVYRAGDEVWAKFDITGFRYGPKNKVDLSYKMSILDGTGKVLWTQPEATTEQTESFYPKLYLPAAVSITIQKGTHPGPYTMAVEVTDAIGNQTTESQGNFSVE
jgi:hypothetical protein